ncbi:MAG: alkaline phosphatase family protein, partial [Sphingobacteriales bacterium]
TSIVSGVLTAFIHCFPFDINSRLQAFIDVCGFRFSVKLSGRMVRLMPLCNKISVASIASKMNIDTVYLLIKKPFFIKGYFLMHLNKAIASEKKGLFLLLKLLILLCLVKTFFLIYNNLGGNGWSIHEYKDALPIISWSLYYDACMISLVSLPFFIALLISNNRSILKLAAIISAGLTTLMLLLNIADVFYFPFHRQRADADLLYVLRNPFNYGSSAAWLIIAAILFATIVCVKLLWANYNHIISSKKQSRFIATNCILLLVCCTLFVGSSKKIIPTAALTSVDAVQIPLTQNSLHTFIYSLYRSKESIIADNNYMPIEKQQALFSINKQNSIATGNAKNIVMFIMESVPYDFFDTTSNYKPALPFLDSLLNHAVFYKNAFSYSYNSNKGITAMLTGLPTITDIPLYHSGFATINKTNIGEVLRAKNYASSFFIGDNYDDFGFAKCCKWTGIDNYYCMEDIPGFKKMEKHSMGLHDEYVLNFMQQKLAQQRQPFFATQYNISTHYPNELPKAYQEKFKHIKIPAALKTMMYYDDCLARFFKQASSTAWYNNTVFIFCSDHWASPVSQKIKNNMVNSFRIPIIIFDPSQNKKQVIDNTVSQLDIMNTLLSYTGMQASFISYGYALTDSLLNNRTVYTKINNSIYQGINNNYVVGFNSDEGKAIYAYEYKKDPDFKNNLLEQQNLTIDSLTKNIQAFLQTATRHYKNKQ